MKRSVLVWMVVVSLLAFTAALAAEHHAAAKKEQAALTPVTIALTGVECPSCTAKLQNELSGVRGASEVKATFKPAQVTAKLDQKVITASAFANKVASTLKKIEPKSKTGASLVVFVDAEMCAGEKKMCGECFTAIPKAFKSVKGVQGVTLDETGKVATVQFTSKAVVTTHALAEALRKSGYTAKFSAVAESQDAKDSCGMGSSCGMKH